MRESEKEIMLSEIDTWKGKRNLKKPSEIKKKDVIKMSLKNQKIFTTSHKDFILILTIYFFIIIEYISRLKGLKITLMQFYFILLRSNNMS